VSVPTILQGSIVGLPKHVLQRFEIPLTPMMFSTGAETFGFNTNSLPGNRQLTAINYIWVDASGLTSASSTGQNTGSVELDIGNNFGLLFGIGTQGFYPLVTTMPLNMVVSSVDGNTRGQLIVVLLNTDEELGLAWGPEFATGGGGGGASLVWNPAVSGTADGANATFTLAGAGPTKGAVIVVNGVLQDPTIPAYTISGVTITFQSGHIPPPGADVACPVYQ
jgi:hypothetical protein